MEQIRLGLLVPAINRVVEPDMCKMAPEGVTVHSTRLQAFQASRMHGAELTELIKLYEQAGDDAVNVAPILAEVEPKVIAFADTTCSFFKGIEYNETLTRRIEDAAGVKVITTTTAAVEALRELGLKKVCLIAPYLGYFTEKLKEYLEASGFEVPSYKGLGLVGRPIDQQSAEAIYETIISTFDKSCDGIFVSCTNFRAVEIIEKVESHLGRPMTSSNQATMWLMLRLADVRKQITGFGQLLTRL